MIRKTLALLLLVPALAVVACGEDEQEAAAPDTTTTTAQAGAFPVTIEHRYGTTEVTEAPKRVFVAGYNEQDALWALGIAPVGVTDWMGFEHGIGPWAQEAATAAGPKPQLLKDTDGIPFEKIAALRPDLIVSLYSDLTKVEYERLSQIAPTLAQPEGAADWGVAWQDTVRIVGRAVGRPDRANDLVADVEARIEREKRAHPEFRGKTAAVVSYTEDIWVYGRIDARSRLLVSLGFELSGDLVGMVGDTYAKKLSDERADLLDIDALAWLIGRAERRKLESKRVYTSLPVHQERRDVFIERDRPDKAVNAIEFQTPLSIVTSLDVLVPALAAAVDGDPATMPPGGDTKG